MVDFLAPLSVIQDDISVMHRVIGPLKIYQDTRKLIPKIIQICPSQMALLIV